MRELTLDEIEQVSGGGIGSYATDGAAGGSFLGALATNTLYGAARGGAIGALGGISFGIGYEIGSALYDRLS
ncbi:MAG: Blp family class II bacteriocin [Gammaproteobacteria bacterium]|nr:Blp family class II bacteriocin [Gammaproteobacteria bacterium]